MVKKKIFSFFSRLKCNYNHEKIKEKISTSNTDKIGLLVIPDMLLDKSSSITDTKSVAPDNIIGIISSDQISELENNVNLTKTNIFSQENKAMHNYAKKVSLVKDLSLNKCCSISNKLLMDTSAFKVTSIKNNINKDKDQISLFPYKNAFRKENIFNMFFLKHKINKSCINYNFIVSGTVTEKYAKITLFKNNIDIYSKDFVKNKTLTSENVTSLEVKDTPLVFRRSNFFLKLKNSLIKTRQGLSFRLIKLFCSKKIDNNLFQKLEEQLIVSDVGVYTTRKIIDKLVFYVNHNHLKDVKLLYEQLRVELSTILVNVEKPLKITNNNPFVILVVGVNGVGKTTFIGKLTRQYQSEGKKVMLAAGDTFRAAAAEQLQFWGEINNVLVITQHKVISDPAAVVFDAIQKAKVNNIDILIIDTAGRLENKLHLMNELKKMIRIIKKFDHNAPHEVMLIIDASTGQNTLNQVNLFNDALKLTGITITKLDGTSKGGIIFSIADKFNIPIRYISFGESIGDLRPFSSIDFIEALFAKDN